MNYNLTLKYFENVIKGQGHDLIGKGHVTYQSIRIVVLKAHLRCFNRSS